MSPPVVATRDRKIGRGPRGGASLRTQSRRWHLELWIAQRLLAVVFAMAGATHLTKPYDVLAQQLTVLQHVSPLPVKFIGTAEVAGVLGLILPAAMRIASFLTLLAALGFVVMMVLAAGFHLSLGESALVRVILALIAAVVSFGRVRKAPIAPRGQ